MTIRSIGLLICGGLLMSAATINDALAKDRSTLSDVSTTRPKTNPNRGGPNAAPNAIFDRWGNLKNGTDNVQSRNAIQRGAGNRKLKPCKKGCSSASY